MRELSTTALRSALAENTDEVWLVLVKISHTALSDSIRVVRDNAPLTHGGEVYVAYPFEIELPEEDPERLAVCQITVDNVDRAILRNLRAINTPCDVVVKVVLASQPDTVEAVYEGLKLRNAKYDAGQITGELSFEDILTEPISLDMTPQWFPGLF